VEQSIAPLSLASGGWSELADVVKVRLVCGCLFRAGESEWMPYCAEHNERRVGHVSAPPPRIRAVDCVVRSPLIAGSMVAPKE
jgi:hypothetical protein